MKFILKLLLALLTLFLLFFIVMYIMTKGDYSIPNTVETNQTLPSLTLSNVTFHAETFGDNEHDVVVVLHGGPGGDYKSLLPLKALSDKYFVIFYDQRGAGLSTRVDAKEQTLDNALQDLENIIEHYSPDKKILIIGHSWGAMLASGYLAKHPNKVKKTVLVEPGMLTSKEAKIFMKKFKPDGNLDYLYQIIKVGFESLHLKNDDKDAKMDYIFGKVMLMDIDGNPMKDYFCNKDIKTGAIDSWRIGSTAVQAILQNGMNEKEELIIDLVSGLENYQDKVLFLTSECNTLIGVEFQKEHMKYFNNAQMVIIKDAGHTMIGEKPKESLSAIRSYFDE